MTKRILVAMSGGVDSSVAAYLLQKDGWTVGGATIRTWSSGECIDRNTRACCGVIGVADSEDVASKLDIPYHVFNFEDEFKTHVVDYFSSEYLKGRTPNPCIACNQHIKFKLFLQRARELGYEKMATGHYARLTYDEASDSYVLRQGVDLHKDQSYVLFPLSRDILEHVELPVGAYTKEEIRMIAKKLGLEVADKPDSQEICFIPSNRYGDFLDRQKERGELDRAAFPDQEGFIQDKHGRVLGRHRGYYHFTIGQRKGLHIAHSHALYVIDIVPRENLVVVGTQEEVLGRTCEVENINWLAPVQGTGSLRVSVKIRSHHQKAEGDLEMVSGSRARVRFHELQDAITPGQACVFYDGDRVLGGGWIADREKGSNLDLTLYKTGKPTKCQIKV